MVSLVFGLERRIGCVLLVEMRLEPIVCWAGCEDRCGRRIPACCGSTENQFYHNGCIDADGCTWLDSVLASTGAAHAKTVQGG